MSPGAPMAHFSKGLCLATGSGSASQSPSIDPPPPPPLASLSCQHSRWFWVWNPNICKGLRHYKSVSGKAQAVPDCSRGEKVAANHPPWVPRAPTRSRTSLCQAYHGSNAARAFACTSLRYLMNTPVCRGTLYWLHSSGNLIPSKSHINISKD